MRLECSCAFVVFAVLATDAMPAATCTGNSSQLSSTDCRAWQSFYDGHGGAQWQGDEVPSNARAEPCARGEYYNVKCEGSHITHVDLLEVGVMGTLSDAVSALSGLSQLAVLELFGNELNGSIPRTIGNFTELWYLDLERNRLTGSIPPELARLSKLNTLYLACNQLSGVVPGLPFGQYTGDCVVASQAFDTQRGCGPGGYGPMRLDCPLPRSAAGCKWATSAGGPPGLDKCARMATKDELE